MLIELESDRLILREISWNDLEDIHSLFSFPEVDEYNTQGIPKDRNATMGIIRSAIEEQKSDFRKQIVWKILKKHSNKFIGIAGMNLSNDRFKLGEIYYSLLPSQWGNGFATEVSKALIKNAFEDFHLHKVEAGVATENVRSIRVLEKSGMTREGLRRKILPIRGEWKDNYHYAIGEDDPRDY